MRDSLTIEPYGWKERKKEVGWLGSGFERLELRVWYQPQSFDS